MGYHSLKSLIDLSHRSQVLEHFENLTKALEAANASYFWTKNKAVDKQAVTYSNETNWLNKISQSFGA